MTYIRIDDRFPTHRKAIAAGPLGRDLYLCGLAYCSLHLTDGIIPSDALTSLQPAPPGRRGRGELAWPGVIRKTAQCLVSCGLWEPVEGIGYRVHDYHDWNKKASEITALKNAKAEAGRQGGRRSGEARRKHPASSAEPQSKQSGSLLRNPASTASIPPISPEAPASTNNLDPSIPYAQRTDRRIWTADGYPRAAFRTDCPDEAWRLRCVSPAFLEAHPEWRGKLPDGPRGTCPDHRAKAAYPWP